MSRNSNSSKNDKLPDIDRYLIPFASQQFEALDLYVCVNEFARVNSVLNAFSRTNARANFYARICTRN